MKNIFELNGKFHLSGNWTTSANTIFFVSFKSNTTKNQIWTHKRQRRYIYIYNWENRVGERVVASIFRHCSREHWTPSPREKQTNLSTYHSFSYTLIPTTNLNGIYILVKLRGTHIREYSKPLESLTRTSWYLSIQNRDCKLTIFIDPKREIHFIS